MNITVIGAPSLMIWRFLPGFLAVAAARGDRLTLGIATDGAAGGTEPGPALAAKRAVEARDGLAGLGVPVGLDLPDGRLAGRSDGARPHYRFHPQQRAGSGDHPCPRRLSP